MWIIKQPKGLWVKQISPSMYVSTKIFARVFYSCPQWNNYLMSLLCLPNYTLLLFMLKSIIHLWKTKLEELTFLNRTRPFTIINLAAKTPKTQLVDWNQHTTSTSGFCSRQWVCIKTRCTKILLIQTLQKFSVVFNL